MQADRMEQLIALKKRAKKSGDHEQLTKIKGMIGEEKSIRKAMEKKRGQHETMKRLKDENKQRIEKGQEPVYLKKRDIKTLKHRDHFDRLEKDGKLDAFMEKKEMSRKRQRR